MKKKEIIMQVRCVEKKEDGTPCGNLMIEKHVDTDRIGKPQRWYRCKLGHWRAIPVEE